MVSHVKDDSEHYPVPICDAIDGFGRDDHEAALAKDTSGVLNNLGVWRAQIEAPNLG